MSPFTWDQRYATGVESIDAQHIALFRSAQELHHAYRVGMAKEGVSHALNHLVVYCMTHFEDEEAHMERLAYAALSVQRNAHRNFLARVYDLRDRYAKGESQVPMELSLLITSWFKKHIKECDQHFADFVREQGMENA